MSSWSCHWLATTSPLSQQTNKQPFLLLTSPTSKNGRSNNKQQSSLSTHAPDLVPSGDLSGPGVSGGPAPVDSMGQLSVALMQGSAMYAMLYCQQFSMTHKIVVRVDNHTFVTTRGNHISRPPGCCPQQGRLGGVYLQPHKVGEQSVYSFK